MTAQPQRDPHPDDGAPRRRRILFLCLGNACRSQMAEGFARAYGSDVLEPTSAGLMPALTVASDTIRAMDQKNINIRLQFPKSWRHLPKMDFDLVINMSGHEAPDSLLAPVRVWKIPDPVMTDFDTHRKVCDQVESLVMGLILEYRRAQKRPRT